MKRCPECRRDYFDDSLLYCLDDGTRLLDGPAGASDEAPTLSLSERGTLPPKVRAKLPWRLTVAAPAIGLTVIALSAYWISTRPAAEKTTLTPADNPELVRAKVLVGSENRGDINTAIQLLEQFVRDEPRSALAWARLARAYHLKAFYFAKDDERRALAREAEVAIERSLALDPELAEGHHARGLLLWSPSKRFPHEQAVQSFKRALAIDPKLDESHHQLALIYLHIGLFDKALAEVGKALEINPGNSMARFRYGVIDLYRGRYEEAYAFFKSTPLETNPSLHAFQTATALFRLGREDEAGELIDRFLRDYPEDEGGVGTSVKAMLLAKRGRPEEAEAAIRRAEELGRDFGHFHHTAFNIASAYAMMDRIDPAVDYVQLAADDGFPCYPLFENDEVFRVLKQNGRFVSMLARLKQQWERYNATL